MTDHTRKGHTVKRIATIAAILTTAAIAVPSVASAGNVARAKVQISAQIVGVQTAKVHRANAAVTVQRHSVALGLSPSSFASSIAIVPPKKSPACKGTVLALGPDHAAPSGLQLYTWSVCGRRTGIPFG
jgi:hypothetical protein